MCYTDKLTAPQFIKFCPVTVQLSPLTGVSELPVVPQSCRRTGGPSWSRRRSCAARARLWSARVTAATPPCTSAGTATPACPWWTSASLWRYRNSCLCLSDRLSSLLPHVTHLFLLSGLSPVSCFLLRVVCPGPLLHRQRTIDSMSFVLLLSCLCFCPFSLFYLHLYLFHPLSFPSVCPFSASVRPR